ncbi:MAG: HD domain-containing protein [Lentisphaeria bacterium]|nr:HD domain-containing protein [Lentisphaeria bacterium]
MIPRHAICIPATPPVDVGAFRPLIDHVHFQRLRGRRQLGVNHVVFPGAVHTRFEHAVGSLALTQRFCRIHGLAESESLLVCAFALLHDIGHGPFSHQIEPILGGDHHRQGLKLLGEMRGELRACGVTYDDLAALFLGEHRLARVVDDRNLGTDKLDYLMRDALHIGFIGAPDIERIQFYTVFEGDIPAIEEKFIEEVKRLQKFYSYLHQHGYLNKTALTAQRVIQRAVQEELSLCRQDPGVLWNMTDEELTGWLKRGRSAAARRLVARLENRRFHRTVVAIKPEGYGFVERCADKPVHVIERPRAQLRRFASLCEDCGRLKELEDGLAAVAGVAPGDVLFAAMPYFRKLLPRDVRIYRSGSGGGFWLFEKDRDHVRSLEGDYLRTFAIRITSVPECRERLARRWEALADFTQATCESGAADGPGCSE